MKIGKTGGELREIVKTAEKKEQKKIITVDVYGQPNKRRIYNPDINKKELSEYMERILGKFSAKKLLSDFEKLELIIRFGFNVPSFGELTYLSDWTLQNAWDDVIEAYNKKDNNKMRYAYEDFADELSEYISKMEEILKKDYGCKDDEHPVFIWKLGEKDAQWQAIRDKIKTDIDSGAYTFLEPQLSEFYRVKKIYEQNKCIETHKTMTQQFSKVDTILHELLRKELVTLAEFHRIRRKLL